MHTLRGEKECPSQLRGDKECPFRGVTTSGRVRRKVPESEARSETRRLTRADMAIALPRMPKEASFLLIWLIMLAPRPA